MKKVEALKDVTGRPGSNELSFRQGEILLVTWHRDKNWWRANRPNGDEGLINKEDVQVLQGM